MTVPERGFDLVVVVASLGGLPALTQVLGGLPAGLPAPLVVALHGRSNGHRERLPWLLQRATQLPVRGAHDGLLLGAPGVVVVPGECRAVVGAGRRLRLVEGARLGGGDALFVSAAQVVGSRTIGVVLTGMLRDGTEGVRAIKSRGGLVIAEDPATAHAGSMPTNAIATGCVDFVLPLSRIAAALVALTTGGDAGLLPLLSGRDR